MSFRVLFLSLMFKAVLMSLAAMHCIPFRCWIEPHLGVSKNRGIPKWMVDNGKPLKWIIWGYHYFRKHPVQSKNININRPAWHVRLHGARCLHDSPRHVMGRKHCWLTADQWIKQEANCAPASRSAGFARKIGSAMLLDSTFVKGVEIELKKGWKKTSNQRSPDPEVTYTVY